VSRKQVRAHGLPQCRSNPWNSTHHTRVSKRVRSAPVPVPYPFRGVPSVVGEINQSCVK